MSKKHKFQASSGRAGSGLEAFPNSTFSATELRPLSYIQEAPDYSTIRDANVVVAFKNLLKKDSTTKTKALEDLQAYVASLSGEPEDGILEAWVRPPCNKREGLVSNDKFSPGPIISTSLYQRRAPRSPVDPYPQRRSVPQVWKEDGKASFPNSRALAGWQL